MKAVFGILAIVFSASPAAALYLDGSKLHGQCAALSKDGSYRVADGLVGGYVAGVIDEALVSRSGKPAFCVSPTAELRDVARKVCGLVLERTPTGTSAAIVVRGALAEAYPCRGR